MIAPPLFSMLLVHPPATFSARLPSRLVEARQMMGKGPIICRRWDVNVRGLDDGAKPLLDAMERLSARFETTHLMCLHEFRPAQLTNLLMAISERQPDVRLSLCGSVDRHTATDFMAGSGGDAIVQIQWRLTGPLPNLGFFKAFSRAGIWNHLVLDKRTATRTNLEAIALQPNIIHSWETVGASNRPERSNGPYDQVRPLPGRPLWRDLKDPVARFLMADRFGKNGLSRLRIDADGDHLYTIGDSLDYQFLRPNTLPGGYLDEICAMVAAGGTVAATHVRPNLKRAFLIGYGMEKGIIVGNSSLKHPRAEYIASVRRQSGLDLTGYVERGYTSVRPEYRGLGIGTNLLKGLTRRAGDRKIFSVIAEDNTATQTIAIRNRTRKVATYHSSKAGKAVGIWIPEWMIEDTK